MFDGTNAFAQSDGPTNPTYVRLDTVMKEYYEREKYMQVKKVWVVQIKKALEGLPEAIAKWDERVNRTLSSVGFKATTHDTSLYLGNFEGHQMIIVRQVDDFLWLGEYQSRIRRLTTIMNTKFNVEMGKIQVAGIHNGVDIIQVRYFVKISVETKESIDMEISKEISSTFPKQTLHEIKTLESKMTFEYRSRIGELMYVYVMTRPDIRYAITK